MSRGRFGHRRSPIWLSDSTLLERSVTRSFTSNTYFASGCTAASSYDSKCIPTILKSKMRPMSVCSSERMTYRLRGVTMSFHLFQQTREPAQELLTSQRFCWRVPDSYARYRFARPGYGTVGTCHLRPGKRAKSRSSVTQSQPHS